MIAMAQNEKRGGTKNRLSSFWIKPRPLRCLLPPLLLLPSLLDPLVYVDPK